MFSYIAMNGAATNSSLETLQKYINDEEYDTDAALYDSLNVANPQNHGSNDEGHVIQVGNNIIIGLKAGKSNVLINDDDIGINNQYNNGAMTRSNICRTIDNPTVNTLVALYPRIGMFHLFWFYAILRIIMMSVCMQITL